MEWVIIDLETTGLSAQRDKIIEIGAVRLCENGERKTFQTLIDPGVSLTENIVNITGINDDMLIGQPYIEEVVPDLLDFTADAVLIAHNAPFDSAFLEPYLGVYKEEWLDTIVLCKMAFPMLESYSLVNLTEYFDISVSGHHRALADALATAELFLLIEKSLETTDKGILAAWEHLLAERRKPLTAKTAKKKRKPMNRWKNTSLIGKSFSTTLPLRKDWQSIFPVIVSGNLKPKWLWQCVMLLTMRTFF